MNEFPIYLGSILLEPNRWPDRPDTTYSRLSRLNGIRQGPPRIKVSEWLERAASDGFDGVELWENHVLLCDNEEFSRLCSPPLPVAVYSSYFPLDDAGALRREVALEAMRELGAQGVKYNFGENAGCTGEYLRNLRAWTAQLDPGVRVICECHGNDIAAKPEVAASLMESLGNNRFQCTVHFADEYMGRPLEDWLKHLGARVRHVHVGRVVEHGKEAVRQRIRLLRDHGFSGTFTIEFTSGIDWGKPQPPVEELYARAVADMLMLKEALQS